ncbi:large subunit ribosomal protein L7/L12 [Seinonella peptonophila]|uniref:Large subunit ribosomal protein L7/L12 n=1 Tax=Seinonella peptonophila TaxID=112248 RepID=A0A1M4VK95_9BACL|nr:hypothetical protein [Seinonella peptonophila]SHE69252.1 large subunit ribosomal protein L7/L12 [Seinonella peptonophila]
MDTNPYFMLFAIFFIVMIVGILLTMNRLEKRLKNVERQLAQMDQTYPIMGEKAGIIEEDFPDALSALKIPVESKQKIYELVRQGKKIQAIKEVRIARPHLSLKEAKDIVDRL